MGIIETIKSFLALRPESTRKEQTMPEEKLTAAEANQYMEDHMLFTPRCSR
jgi:hypothetical protein